MSALRTSLRALWHALAGGRGRRRGVSLAELDALARPASSEELLEAERSVAKRRAFWLPSQPLPFDRPPVGLDWA